MTTLGFITLALLLSLAAITWPIEEVTRARMKVTSWRITSREQAAQIRSLLAANTELAEQLNTSRANRWSA